ncbi:MAG: 30S ribosomal protein S8 [Planctomycetota bacterium]|jgi:small subunit ribosomal protein S8|nr:30S ribosomal protein S8 [Planctomycetota bacterium]
MMTDPIADMLTRIRNAVAIERPFVDIPESKLKVGVAEVLQREGYIWDFELLTVEGAPCRTLRVNLKYGPNGERVIQEIKRISKPGCRVYRRADQLGVVLQDMGISILTTSRGMLSNREAKAQKVGGEVLCSVS